MSMSWPDSRSCANLIKYACGALMVGALAACATPKSSRSDLLTPYKVVVPQGNYLDVSMLGSIKAGMTPEQVQFALGTPLLKDVFRPDQWHYVFRFQHANGQVDLRRSTIFFANGRVEKISTDALPTSDQGPDPALPSPIRRAGRFR